MATSSTVTYRPLVEEIIIEAYERGGLDAQIITGYQARMARRSINLVFADWSTRGINLWTLTQTSQALVASTASYTLPVGTIDVLEPSIRRSSIDTEILRLSLSEYQSLPNKTTEGLASSYFMDRQYTPIMYLWPVPENSTDTFEYWAMKQVEDVTASNQDTDIPYRWTEALCAGLAFKLYEKSSQLDYNRLNHLKEQAALKFDNAEMEERDKANLQIWPA